MTRKAAAGINTIAFAKLAPGRYRVRVAATDAAGNRARARSVRFTIRRR